VAGTLVPYFFCADLAAFKPDENAI